MIKIVVNADKGGVGKTTTATNIALYLAKNNHSVWAIDLSSGNEMGRALKRKTKEFDDWSNNRVDTREDRSIPSSFQGANDYEYAVMDTDDTDIVPIDLLDHVSGEKRGWRVIVPIEPRDDMGLEGIVDTIATIKQIASMEGKSIYMRAITNMRFPGEIDEYHKVVKEKMSEERLENILHDEPVPYSKTGDSPIHIEDPMYYQSIASIVNKVV